MSPMFTMAVQMLQALGLLSVLQNFIIAILSLAVLFMVINYFRGRS